MLQFIDRVPENLGTDVICGAHSLPGKYELETSMLTCAALYNWAGRTLGNCEDLAARVDELAPLEDEVKELRAQVEEFKPQAEAYADVKSKLADIELEAHARSAQVVKQAEEEAAGKRLEAQAMLDEIMQEYSHVGSTANTAITDVICKLTDLRASLSRLGELEQKLGGRSHE